jgi:perosamine synthetase
MDAIMDIAEDHSLYVIEDAAEAHGAEYKGRKVGSFGDVSCFSFYGNKIITTGEGGMCLTDNEELRENIRALRDHAMDPNKRYWHDAIGFNYRMTNMQAAIGVAQLTKINQFIEKKRQIAGWYKEGLEDLANQGMVIIHPEMSWAKCVYWMYSILVEDKFGINRDELIQFLEKRGIETRPFFYPIHVLPPYKTYEDTLNIAKNISSKGLNLPSSPTLEKSEIEYIVESITKIVDEVNK